MSNFEEVAERLCKEVLDGWTITLNFENGSEWIEIYDDTGNEIFFDEDFERPTHERLESALDVLIAKNEN